MKKIVCISLCIITLFSSLLLVGCFEEEPKVFVWDEIVLREKLPEPNTNLGKCIRNTDESLDLEVVVETETSYSAYVQACKEKGFTIDPEVVGDRYSAYNAEGYKLSLSCYGDEMNIKLTSPMKVSQIAWPSAEYAKAIPVPPSLIGKISSESSSGFSIYIANTTVEEYNKYVQACSDSGFNVDYSKSERSYRAKNAQGYSLSLSYEGFNIIYIDLDCPSESAKSESSDKVIESTESESADKVVTDGSLSVENSSGLGTDFKEAMDSYEQFMDEYVKFMKKYEENPSDLGLISDYATFMSKYSSFVSDFESWEEKDLNAAELEYYLQVQTRVNQKLLEILQ